MPGIDRCENLCSRNSRVIINERMQQVFASVNSRHQQLADDCGIKLNQQFTGLMHELQQRLDERNGRDEFKWQAEILSMGERYSSFMVQIFLQQQGMEVTWLDAAKALRSEPTPHQSPRARYLSTQCAYSPDDSLQQQLNSTQTAWITQGYVASNDLGERVLLGRGGSDTSAAYFAAKLQADSMEIWTDVPGLFSANPHKLSSARLLKQLSYAEAQELASIGVKVLHPRCIAPARSQGIPIQIRQTTRPELNGTLISAQAGGFSAQVKAILHRSNITLISMESLAMWHQAGFLADVFAVFRQAGLSVDMVSTSEASITVSLDLESNLLDASALQELTDTLSKICRVKVLRNCASVSMVGQDIRNILNHIRPAMEGIENHRLHMLSQASSDLNLSMVVDEKDAQALVQQLHHNLIPGNVGGDSVFGRSWEQLNRRTKAADSEMPAWWRQKRGQITALMEDQDAAFVYDLNEVASAAQRLRGLTSVSRIFYALKANSEARILKVIEQQGLGFECVSLGELNWVLQMFPDIAVDRILFTPNFAMQSEYREALLKGVHVTVDNSFMIEHWGDMFAGHDILLRIDTGLGSGHHKKVRTAGKQSKFGIPIADLDRLVPLLKEKNVRIVGLHAHTGSGMMHIEDWSGTLRSLLDIKQHFEDIQFIDIGGGLGVPEREGELTFDLQALDEILTKQKDQLAGEVEIWLEPGRYLVAQAGVLVAKVTQLKGKGRIQYLGIAAGMNSLIRPTLYGAWHQVFNLSRLNEAATQIYSIVGPICETGDFLARDRGLPTTFPGDLILITNCGAYGASMASNYNMRSPAKAMFCKK